MAVFKLTGTDATDDEQKRGSFINAIARSLEAVKEHPALNESAHQANVQDIQDEVVAFTGFKIKTTNRKSNYYETHRFDIKGFNVPGTSLKFDCCYQMNFTQKNAIALESHLVAVFPNLKINVSFGDGKARFVVHVCL